MTDTQGAAEAPSSFEELVRTLRHASNAHGDSATAELLREAASALFATMALVNAVTDQRDKAWRDLERTDAERDAAVARAEAAEAAIRQEIEVQTKHYGQVAACAAAGSRLHEGEADCTEGIIMGLEIALRCLTPETPHD